MYIRRIYTRIQVELIRIRTSALFQKDNGKRTRLERSHAFRRLFYFFEAPAALWRDIHNGCIYLYIRVKLGNRARSRQAHYTVYTYYIAYSGAERAFSAKCLTGDYSRFSELFIFRNYMRTCVRISVRATK